MATTTANAQIQALVGRMQGGDREAFGAIYEQLAPKVYSYLYHRINGQAQLAEDLTEEVFLKVLEKLDRYEDRGLPFVAWVYRVAQNHLIDHFRRPTSQGALSIDECGELAEQQAERSLDWALTHGELTRALGQLTEDQRCTIVLRFFQGMSIEQAAQAMGKTEDSVKKLQARGLSALRSALRARGIHEFAELAA